MTRRNINIYCPNLDSPMSYRQDAMLHSLNTCIIQNNRVVVREEEIL